MNDWDVFTECVPWFPATGRRIRVSQPRHGLRLPTSVGSLFPTLNSLFSVATVTSVMVDDEPFELLAWDSTDCGRTGWLCPRAQIATNSAIHPDHASLLSCFGGIVERFNEPGNTWLVNLNGALTEGEARHDGSFIEQYRWAFDKAGLTIPIRLTDYYSIAREANGNNTLCHRRTGQVLLFAPDHAFNYVTPLEGCPKYSLYTLSGVATFRDWVETVAFQWLAHVHLPK